MSFTGENKNIEYKQEIPSNHEKLLKDLIAFANTSGGQVIIGVRDGTGEVIGIGEQNPFRMADRISNMIFDNCEPQMEPTIYPGTLDGKTVLYIDVVPGKNRPYYLKSVGREKSSYIRLNGISVPASEWKIKELEMEGHRLSYDIMAEIGRPYDEEEAKRLCEEMHEEALRNCTSEEQRRDVKEMTIQKLEDMEILRCEGRDLFPTHAYALLADNRDRNAIIQCARFRGTGRSVFIDRREIEGPIHQQVEEAYQFVKKHINIGVDIVGIHSVDVFELPMWSVREMIANAVVHRSYLVESRVQVSVYDDRIEVDSPGMLFGGLDMARAMSGTSRCRNAAIAEAFQYMRIIDRWGTGIPRIIDECRAYGLPEPRFEEIGDSIRVTMYRKLSEQVSSFVNTQAPKQHPSDTPKHPSDTQDTPKREIILNELDRSILGLLRVDARMSQMDIAKSLGANINAVKTRILKMREAGILEREGTSQKGYWRITEEINDI